MKIILAGAGTVGKSLAGQLCSLDHDVTVIDLDEDRLRFLDELYDLVVQKGDATNVRLMQNIGADKADLVVAITNSDAVNIMVGHIANRMGAEHCIARIRHRGVFSDSTILDKKDMGLDQVIYPEVAAAEEVHNLLMHPYADQTFTYLSRRTNETRIQVVSLTVGRENAVLPGSTIESISKLSDRSFRIAAIQREEDAFIPSPDKAVRVEDRIFVVAASRDMRQVVRDLGFDIIPLKKVFIHGGSRIGLSVARRLEAETDVQVGIIEPDQTRAKELAYELERTLVLFGEGTESELLSGEGVSDADVFVSVTKDENSNLLSCLLAKQLGVKKTIALVAKPDYVPLVAELNVDSVVSQRLITINRVLRAVREGAIMVTEELVEGKIQALQFVVTKHTHVVGKAFGQPEFYKEFPQGAVIGGIDRRIMEKDEEVREVVVPDGNTVLSEGDRVVVFCATEVVKKLEAFFAT